MSIAIGPSPHDTMDIRSMLNEGGHKPPPNPPSRSASMITEDYQRSPITPSNTLPTRSMSISTITEDLPPPQPAQSLKRSSPSHDHEDQLHNLKRARISESKSPVVVRKRAATPEYAKRMTGGSKEFSDVKADLRPQPQTNGRNGDNHRRSQPAASAVSAVSIKQEPGQRPDVPVPTSADNQLEPNISGIAAYNSIQRMVMDMLFDNVIVRPDIPEVNGIQCKFEVEAKLGKLIDRHSKARLQLPVLTDSVLQPHRLDTAFEPALTKMQYARLNKYLNDMVARSRHPSRSGIKYTHPKQVDRFYHLTREGFAALPLEVRELHEGNPNHKLKLRVTTDPTGAVTARIVKIRVGDLEIYCPGNEFDIRISVNLECSYSDGYEAAGYVALDADPEDSRPRDKDRLSYQHQASSIDLTLVKNNRQEESFEIEVELDSDALLLEGRKVLQGQDNSYEKIVGQMVENALVLSRAAVDEANKPDASQVRH